MYNVERHENMDGFWGDLKRKIKKNTKKIGIASAFIPGIGTSAFAIVKPVETAAIVATAGAAGAVSAGGAAAGAPTLQQQAQKYIDKAKEVKASIDAAKAAFKKPKTDAGYDEPAAAESASPEWYKDPKVLMGGAALLLTLLTRR